MKIYKIITIFLILATTLPFFFFINQIDYSLLEFSEKIFYINLSSTFASIFGYIGAVLIMWQNFLGNRFIVKKFSDDYMWFNKIHMWIGKYGMLLLLIHPLLILYAYAENWLWLFVPKAQTDFELHVTFGRLAFIIFLVIYFTSALLRSKIKYRPWLYIHYLTYPMLFFVFYHALDLGNFLQKIPALYWLWLSLFALFGILFFYRIIKYAGLGNPQYKIIAKETSGENAFVLTLQPLGKKLIPKPGQYFYFQISAFGEAHPFSMVDFDSSTGNIKLGVKVFGKFTKKVSDLPLNTEISLDGAYGVFTREAQNPKNKVMLAGGIGITPFVNLVKHFSNPGTFLFYSNSYLKDAMFRQELKNILGKNYYDFISREELQGENIINGHMTAENLHQILGTDLHKYNFFICGSKRYIEGMEKVLREARVEETRIFCEKFY